MRLASSSLPSLDRNTSLGTLAGVIRFVPVHWLPGRGTLMRVGLYRTEHRFLVGGKPLAEGRDDGPRGALAVSRKM